MRCQEIRQLLSCRLDGMLDDEQLNTVKKHLEDCRSCRSYWHYLQSDAKMLRDMPEMAPPAGFRDELREKLENLAVPKVSTLPRKGILTGFANSVAKPWLAGVAALLVFVFGITAFGDMPGLISNINDKFQVSQVGNNPKPVGEDILKQGQDSDQVGVIGDIIDSEEMPEQDTVGKDQTDGRDKNTLGDGKASEHEPVTNNHGKDSPPKTTENKSEGSKVGTNTEPKTGEFYTTSGEQKVVIKNVKIKLAVSDLDAASKRLDEVAKTHCVTLEQGKTRDSANELRYSICVPVTEMHNAIEKLETMGQVITSLVENEDITKKYSTVESNINELNAKIAGLEKDIAACEDENEQKALEQQLKAAKEELSSQKFRLKGFDDAVIMATINLAIELQ